MATVTHTHDFIHTAEMCFSIREQGYFVAVPPAAKLPQGPGEPGLTWHEGQTHKRRGGGGVATLKERIDFPVGESSQ